MNARLEDFLADIRHAVEKHMHDDVARSGLLGTVERIGKKDGVVGCTKSDMKFIAATDQYAQWLTRYAYTILFYLVPPYFSDETKSQIFVDVQRGRALLKRHRDCDVLPPHAKLHLGCGSRRVPGWLNVDIQRSDYDVDLAGGYLPWKSGVFDLVVSQHFVEHLELQAQLLPLFEELRRVLRQGGEIWLSCPDIEKICRSYLDHGMLDLLEDRRSRFPSYSLEDIPTCHLINDLFHQGGEHKNLFDFELLEWALNKTGFSEVVHVNEEDLLQRFPEFPARKDDAQSIYVWAIAA